MTFSISFPKMFKRTIGQNNLGNSYDILFGFGMIINNKDLKYNGQYPRSIHALAILIIFFKQSISLTTALRCFH